MLLIVLLLDTPAFRRVQALVTLRAAIRRTPRFRTALAGTPPDTALVFDALTDPYD